MLRAALLAFALTLSAVPVAANLAAAQGHEKAKNARDLIAKRMTSEQIAEAQRLAREWRPK